MIGNPEPQFGGMILPVDVESALKAREVEAVVHPHRT